jgi:hypothetical protein
MPRTGKDSIRAALPWLGAEEVVREGQSHPDVIAPDGLDDLAVMVDDGQVLGDRAFGLLSRE